MRGTPTPHMQTVTPDWAPPSSSPAGKPASTVVRRARGHCLKPRASNRAGAAYERRGGVRLPPSIASASNWLLMLGDVETGL